MGLWSAPFLASCDLGDASVVMSDSPTAASMPLGYLQLLQPGDRTRFTDVTEDIVIDVNLAPGKAVTGDPGWRVVALPVNNSSSTGTWTVSVAASQAGLDSPVASWTQDLWPSSGLGRWGLRIYSVLYQGTARTEDWLRITISDTTPRKAHPSISGAYATATYFDIGRLVIAYGYRPGDAGGNTGANRSGVIYGASDGLREDPRQVIGEGGQRFPQERPRARSKALTLRADGAAARAEFLAHVEPLRRAVGVSRGVFVIEDVEFVDGYPLDGMLYGTLDGLQDTSLPEYHRWEVQATILELMTGATS